MKPRWVSACLLLLGTFWFSSVAAQERKPSAQEKAAAIALADEGLEHYDAGQYAEALVAFREAEQKIHAPTFREWPCCPIAFLGIYDAAR
ncbi:hypothetical protein [Sorangium sp. So ce233]|uniref:hypothetical protein n=1 Tax=Sorangium sp. So ce233 TaxID=3133290 RepID=UPI003F5E65CA